MSEVKAEGWTSGRQITLDPLLEHTLRVKAKRVESTIGCGYRAVFLTASDIPEDMEFTEAVLTSGAGFGSPWVTLEVKMRDGEVRQECIDMREVMSTWIDKIVADGPTPPWWYGQYPQGTEVDVFGKGSGWVLEPMDHGLRIALDDGGGIDVAGDSIVSQVRKRGA